MAVSVFTSCSKSDSIDEQPPQDKSCKIQSFTHLLDEINKGSYDEYVSTFYYDSQNRFSKIENKYKNRIEFGRFIYEANTIKYSEDDLEITYTLNTKGLIVRSDSRSPYNTGGIQVNYTYNSSNQLVAINSVDSGYKIERELIYENGNLVKVNWKSSWATWTEAFTFTNDKAPLYNSAYLNLFGSTDGSENLLYSQGHFGVTSKNMVKSLTTSGENNPTKTIYYESSVDQKGNIIEVIPSNTEIYRYNYQCN